MSGDGPTPVLLLHGQPGTSSDWQWVTPHLQDRYTVIAPDRPGYGRTGGPAAGFAANAAAAVGLLDDLGFDRAVWVAHSWAGGVAIAAAEAYPARVGGLVLISSVGPGEPPAWDDRVLAAPVAGEIIAAATVAGISIVLGSRRVRDLAYRRLAGRPRDAVVALTQLTGLETDAPGRREPVWRSFVSEQRALLGELGRLGPGLTAIDTPTVILHGGSDRVVAPAVAEHLRDSIPGAVLTNVGGVGHLLPHDRPEAVARAVDEVVARARPAG